MKSDGKYQRTKETTLRQAKTATETRYGLGGRKKEGAHVPRPITLPPMPWDKKPDADQDDGDK